MEQQTFNQQNAPTTQPKNWLVESILVLIFCCIPFGIVGLVYASQVNAKWAAGDHAGALKASQDAGKWTKIGFFVSIACWIIYMVLIFAFGFTGFWASRAAAGY